MEWRLERGLMIMVGVDNTIMANGQDWTFGDILNSAILQDFATLETSHVQLRCVRN